MANVMGATLGLFKSMLDTAKSLKDMNDAVIRNAAVIELQEKILAAQEQQTSLLEYVIQIEEKLESFEKWENEKKRYEMETTSGGSVIWSVRPDAQGSELPHKICPNCYENRKRSILQPKRPSIADRQTGAAPRLFCPSCEIEVIA